MLIYVTASASGHPPVSWVSSNPLNPYLDYRSFGSLPGVASLGSYSIVPLTLEDVWSMSLFKGTLSITPRIGVPLFVAPWRRSVDASTDIIVSLNETNISPSWVRLNDTDIAPRSAI